MRERREKETNLVNDNVVERWISSSTSEEEELLVAGSSPGDDDDRSDDDLVKLEEGQELSQSSEGGKMKLRGKDATRADNEVKNLQLLWGPTTTPVSILLRK